MSADQLFSTFSTVKLRQYTKVRFHILSHGNPKDFRIEVKNKQKSRTKDFFFTYFSVSFCFQLKAFVTKERTTTIK